MVDVLEAAPGFEPGVKDLQSSALPLGYAAIMRGIYIIRGMSGGQYKKEEVSFVCDNVLS